MKSKDKASETGASRLEIQRLKEELRAMQRQIVALEERLSRVEVSEELWQEPGAAGDQPLAP
jgi:hypothetical protein